MTTFDNGNPLFNTKHEKLRIEAVLRHLGSGAELRDLPGSATEKAALVKTANQRGLIAWHKGRGRYELTASGWCELAPSRRFGVGSMMMGTTVGASLGAAALAVFWFTAGAAHRPLPPRPVVAAVAKARAPAPVPAVTNTPPATPTPSFAAAPTPAPAAPVAAPVEPEPTKVAQEPTPEERAEAAAKAKHAAWARKKAIAAKREKARQRAAARRKREDAARNWAANGPRGRQADGGNGGYGGYGNYGGQNPWYAYR